MSLPVDRVSFQPRLALEAARARLGYGRARREIVSGACSASFLRLAQWRRARRNTFRNGQPETIFHLAFSLENNFLALCHKVTAQNFFVLRPTISIPSQSPPAR